MTVSECRLTDAQMVTLRRLADVVTPPVRGFPSAAEADPTGDVLAMALAEFVRDLPQIADYLDLVASSTESVDCTDLAALEAADPEGFAVVCDLLVGRYLTCRPVWKLLGYPGRVPAEPTSGEAEFHLRDDLLNPVIARGPVYTLPPPRSQR